jgi:hypothetical protein
MTPLKHRQIEGPEIVQFMGLLVLIDLIYKYFGPGIHAHVTLSSLTVFAVGMFLVLWPMSLKVKQ